MLAKLIVVGADRQQALERSRRALAEFTVEGLPTVLPFHRAVVDDPAFAATDADGFTVHTRWIETEFSTELEAFSGAAASDADPPARQTVVVEVGGRRLEVSLPGDLTLGAAGPDTGGSGATGSGAGRAAPRKRTKGAAAAASSDAVTAPMQGTVVKVAVSDGDTVVTGDLIVLIEAMKMENPITAHKNGTVTGLTAEAGSPVTQGAVLCELKD